jgi:zinc protease
MRIDPGVREPYQEASATNRPAPDNVAACNPATRSDAADWRRLPISTSRTLNARASRTALRSSMRIVTPIPATLIAMDFDAGIAADPQGAFGTQRLMLSAMTAGADGRDAMQIAEEQERLGASIAAFGSLDRSTVSLTALSANLDLSLDLYADIVLRPDFVASEVERLREQQLAQVAQEATSPNGLAQRTLPPIIYGENHPYGRPTSGLRQ